MTSLESQRIASACSGSCTFPRVVVTSCLFFVPLNLFKEVVVLSLECLLLLNGFILSSQDKVPFLLPLGPVSFIREDQLGLPLFQLLTLTLGFLHLGFEYFLFSIELLPHVFNFLFTLGLGSFQFFSEPFLFLNQLFNLHLEATLIS